MAVPMMRHPGLLGPAMQLQRPSLAPNGGLLNPSPMAPTLPMGPSNFDPWPTKPGFPPAPMPPASRGERFGAHMRDRFADIMSPEVMLPVAVAMMAGDNWRQSAAGGMLALGQGVVGKRRRNSTVEMLKTEDPQLAEWVESGAIDPKDAFTIFAQERKARANMKDNESYFGNVIKGVGPDGKPAYFQTSNQGNIKQVQLPDGFRPEENWEKLDLGTHWLIRNTRDGTQQMVPKELYQEGFQSTSGAEDAKAAAARRANLPKVESTASQMLSTLDALEKHPGFTGAVGWQGNIPDWMIPSGTDAAGFMSQLQQVQGQAFLQAFESLKGGGQITQIEGEKATAAISRLSRNLSEAEFKAAIQELRATINRGLERARRGVVVDASGQEVPAGSQAGTGGTPAPSGRMRFDANGNQIQ